MLSGPRIGAAVVLGTLGCLFIWVATPYNNFYLNNSYISDSYFPVSAVIFMLALVLGLNPALRWLRRDGALNRRQLALILVMLLAASVLPSQGLLRMLPWSLARANQRINHEAPMARAFEQTGVPHALFPDPIGYGVDTPVSDQFLDELDPGATIPWGNWLGLLPVWGGYLLACWLLMAGVGWVMFPHWKESERLPFPLLDVYRGLLPEADSNDFLPALYRDRLFWLGASVVMLLYAFNGLNHHTHGRVPAFPMGWNLSGAFSEVPWRYLPGSIKNVGHIYFILVGMAFFMPNRVGFSIWAVTVAYAVYEMLGRAYLPAYYAGAVHDHRNGAMIVVSLMVLYLSRRHWPRVARAMLARATSDADRLLQMSGWMLTAGAAGMMGWLVWTGVPAPLAILFVFIGFVVSLLISRIVAETGLPFVRVTGMSPFYFMAMMPAGWLSGAAIYMAGFIDMLFPLGSRVSAAVFVSHAAGLDERASARFQLRLGYLMIAVLSIGLVVCGAVHLHMGYTQPHTLDGTYQPINVFGRGQMDGPQNSLLRWSQGSWPMPVHRLGHLGFGMALTLGLQLASMSYPGWPLHPIGMLMVGHFYGQLAWASVLIGWAVKVVLIHFGGAAAFRRARPLFLGIILGEVFSAILWTLVPVVLLWMGHDPSTVGHIPILPQ